MKEKKSFFRLMQKIPGGLIIVPMLIGVLANTFIPSVLEIGGFTTGMFKTGTNCLLGMFLMLNGASINVKKIGLPLYKGFVLTLVKIYIRCFVRIDIVAVTGKRASWVYTNGNYSGNHKFSRRIVFGIAQQYGDESDAGAISILYIKSRNFFLR